MFSKARLQAAGIHLGISLILAALAALLVFFVWYPYPYREISGGRNLFLLVIAVDVVMGPLLTFAVFSPGKSRRMLRFDLAVIGAFQLAALGYGLWTVAVARPVHLVFEISRFLVVHAIDVSPELLEKAPPALRQLPLTGPTLLSVREFKDNAEQTDVTMAALAGLDVGARPDLWQSYESGKSQILQVVRPLADLKTRFPDRVGDIDKALSSAIAAGRSASFVGYVPMIGRGTFWTVLVDASTTEVIAFVPIDSF